MFPFNFYHKLKSQSLKSDILCHCLVQGEEFNHFKEKLS